MSMGEARVSMEEYLNYSDGSNGGEAGRDVAPLYVFDYRCLQEPVYHTDEDDDDADADDGVVPSTPSLPPLLPPLPPPVLKPSLHRRQRRLKRGCVFADTGEPLCREFSVPKCFTKDVMSGLTGTQFRPLPPAWLLVGCKRSGTPIHDHPATVAWNALLSGCKLWCVLPPTVDESALLLLPEQEEDDGGAKEKEVEEGEGDDDDFDLSALQWFGRHCVETTPTSSSSDSSDNNNSDNNSSSSSDSSSNGNSDSKQHHPHGAITITPTTTVASLPLGAVVAVQRPGETVFVPAGWWHVVLNVTDSVALSHSLALRRDLATVLPALVAASSSSASADEDDEGNGDDSGGGNCGDGGDEDDDNDANQEDANKSDDDGNGDGEYDYDYAFAVAWAAALVKDGLLEAPQAVALLDQGRRRRRSRRRRRGGGA
jgi:hypothetical protein